MMYKKQYCVQRYGGKESVYNGKLIIYHNLKHKYILEKETKNIIYASNVKKGRVMKKQIYIETF